MAALYYSNGLLTIFSTDSEEIFGPRPDNAQIVRFDETTNKSLLSDIKANRILYTINNGVLFKNGNQVIINPDGRDISRLKSLPNVITALKIGSGTNAERIRRCELQLLHIIKFLFKIEID